MKFAQMKSNGDHDGEKKLEVVDVMAAAEAAAQDGGEQLAIRDLVALATGSSTCTAAMAAAAVQIKQEVESGDDCRPAKRLRAGVGSAADPAWQGLTHGIAHWPSVKNEQLHADQAWQRLALASRESEEDVPGVTEEDNANDAGREDSTAISAAAVAGSPASPNVSSEQLPSGHGFSGPVTAVHGSEDDATGENRPDKERNDDAIPLLLRTGAASAAAGPAVSPGDASPGPPDGRGRRRRPVMQVSGNSSDPAMESPKQTASTDLGGEGEDEGEAGGRPDQLSEYERMRLANIKRNEAELARLGLHGATAKLAARNERKTKAVKRKRAHKAIEPAAPTWRSSRKRSGGAAACTEGAMMTIASHNSETDTADENPSDAERERRTTEQSTAAAPMFASAGAAPPGGQTRHATRSQRALFVPLKVGDHVLVESVHRTRGPHLAIICKEAVAEVGKIWKVKYDDGYDMLRHVPVGNLTKVTPEEAVERARREKGNVTKRKQLAVSSQALAIEVAQSEAKAIAQVLADIKRKLGLKQFHSKKTLRKIAAELDVDTGWQTDDSGVY